MTGGEPELPVAAPKSKRCSRLKTKIKRRGSPPEKRMTNLKEAFAVWLQAKRYPVSH